MAIQDLRDWLQRVDEMGELTRIRGADPASDVGALTDLSQWDMGNPALLFDDLKGYAPGHRIASNTLTSLSRVALTLHLPTTQTAREFVQALRDHVTSLEPVPARFVDDGPVLENRQTGDEVDLETIPPRSGTRRTAGCSSGPATWCVMRDSEAGWVNAGTYRVPAPGSPDGRASTSPRASRGGSSRRSTGGAVRPARSRSAWGWTPSCCWPAATRSRRGPASTTWPAPIGVSPSRCWRRRTPGFRCPPPPRSSSRARCRRASTCPEGPFGEWAGYYATGQMPAPVMHVRSVIHRDDPIVLGCLPGKPPNDNTYWRSPMRGALIWNELERAGVPGITGVWSHEAGGGRLFNVVSIRQLYPGHAKQVGMAAASFRAGAYANRYVVVVDDDIDPTDTNEVIWALCTRTDVAGDIDLMRRGWTSGVDPMAYQREGPGFFNDRLVIDACRPYDRRHTFPAVARVSHDEAAEVRPRWPGLFGPDGKVSKEARAVARDEAIPPRD